MAPAAKTSGAAQYRTANGHAQRAQTGTILTAHFLKSVCLDIGSVASSVTLLMSWLASNQGTNTTPRGIRLRPRMSMRVRISPRRETTRTSAPWLMPALARVLGIHETTRAGKRLVQFRHPHGHGARMPMLQDAAGYEPDIELLVGRFRRRLVRNGDDFGAAVGLTVEVDALARL